MGSTPVGSSENSFSEYFDLRTFFAIYALSKSPIHLSFIHIYHFDTSSIAVWQDTCHTYKNLVYDPAHHESLITQWLERPNRYLEGHGFDSHWGLGKFFSLQVPWGI